jgi:hypothetical protein
MGYAENGRRWVARRGAPARMIFLRLDRGIWEDHQREDLVVEGLEDCRSWFGIGEDSSPWEG